MDKDNSVKYKPCCSSYFKIFSVNVYRISQPDHSITEIATEKHYHLIVEHAKEQ